MRKKRVSLSTIILFIILLVGISVMLYPTVSDWWNSRVQTKMITNYYQAVSALDTKDYSDLWDNAKAYNESLGERKNPYLLSEEQREDYMRQLNPGGDGVMGSVEIPLEPPARG